MVPARGYRQPLPLVAGPGEPSSPGIVVASTLLLGGALALGLLAMTSEALRLKLLGVGGNVLPAVGTRWLARPSLRRKLDA